MFFDMSCYAVQGVLKLMDSGDVQKRVNSIVTELYL
jgi:hypothetical protein